MLNVKVIEKLNAKYGQLSQLDLLKTIAEESRLLSMDYCPNQHCLSREENALIHQATTYFFIKFGKHLTVGDITKIELFVRRGKRK